MTQTKNQLLSELGFSDELIAKMNEGNEIFDFTPNNQTINFNCVHIENQDFSEIFIEKIEQPFVSSINYSE